MNTFELTDLISAAAPGLTAPERCDPHYDGLWTSGASAGWAVNTSVAALEGAGLGRIPKWLRSPGAPAALSAVTEPNSWHRRRLDLLGVLDSYRTATDEQAAALTGDAALTRPQPKFLSELFTADLIDLGEPAQGIIRGKASARLLRPSSGQAFAKGLAPTLTWAELTSVTGGHEWDAGGQYDRHNILSTELLLRLAEYAPVGTIMGEKMSSVDLLLGSGLGRTIDRPDNRRADGLIVRPDGLRIAIEMTANTSQTLERKIRRWCEALQANSLADSGLVLLFVVPEVKKGGAKVSQLRALIARVLLDFPGYGPDSVAERIGVAAWADYFPARHQGTEEFLDLTAYFPTGDAPDTLWQPRAMLDVEQLPFTPTFDATAVLTNSSMLAATPHWLREQRVPWQLGAITNRAAGFSGPLEISAEVAAELGEGAGCVRAKHAPERLVLSASR